MILRLLWFLLCASFFFSCGETQRVKVRDDEGNVVEEYSRKKTDFAKHGTYIAYFPEGGKQEVANYVHDTLDGERRIFYPNGDVQIIEHYQMGQFVGLYQAFYEENKLELEGYYLENAMSGSWKRYYKNGQLFEEVQFENNEENGPFMEYHENGNLKTKGTYLNGDHEQGLLELYDSNGQLERTMDCDKGICRTTWLRDSTAVQN